MRIKNIVYSLSIVLSITLVGGLLPTKVANAASLSYSMNPSISTNKALTTKETSQVESEINVLKNCHIDTSVINRVNVMASGNEYILKYRNHDEKVMIKSNDAKGVTLIASDGEKSNVISFEKDGSIIIDGYKVQISQENQIDTNAAVPSNTNVAVSSSGTTYKSIKSLSPYGGLQPSDYNQYLSTGQQNIALGKSIDKFTVTALEGLLACYAFPYVGICEFLGNVAADILDYMDSSNPATQYLGLIYTTYTTVGGDDYQYYNRFYGNVACTGPSVLEISYEHFTVY